MIDDGRALDRTYGGSSLVSLGTSQIGVEDFRPEPTFTFGEKTHDKVRQKTLGLGYQLLWREVGEISLGVQKTRYRKSVVTPTERHLSGSHSPASAIALA